MTVDGTDCRVSEPRPYIKKYNRQWYSIKFGRAGVRYEIGVCIKTGNIVWYNGPYPCGAYTDCRIFQCRLKWLLGPTEKVLVDRGYGNDPKVLW
jgi:hypothetical protein